jgi:hypothetical protein
MTDQSPIDLKRLKELDAKATPGPWRFNAGPNWQASIRADQPGYSNFAVLEFDSRGHIHNGELIAASRTELPKLVAWIERAKKYLENKDCTCGPGIAYRCANCELLAEID